MKTHEHIVKEIIKNSIADELGIEPGDKLLSINGQEIEDIFDYQFYSEDEEILLLIEKPDGEQWELEIEKDADEQLGMEFGSGLMDEYRSCRTKCIFCFIDQMPEGMRDTLYFKDDDSRLSFLQGNYVTLTNMSDHDIERIIKRASGANDTADYEEIVYEGYERQEGYLGHQLLGRHRKAYPQEPPELPGEDEVILRERERQLLAAQYDERKHN